jgi:GT2 family glycosyltransferase
MNKPQVHVIVVNWNRPEDTNICVESILKSTYCNYKIVICDNGSSSDSIESMERWLIDHGKSYSNYYCNVNYTYDNIKNKLQLIDRFDFNLLQKSENIVDENIISILRSDENVGFTGGCNICIDYALKDGADYVLLINNDAIIDPNCIENSVQIARKTNAKIVGCTIWNESGSQILFNYLKFPIHLFVPLSWKKLTLTEESQEYWTTDSANGAGMMIERTFLYKRLDKYKFIFDESFFMYCEEFDLCLYAKSVNENVIISSKSIIFHEVGKSSGGSSSYLSCYYETRNRLYLASSWLSPIELILFHIYYVPSRIVFQLRRSIRLRKITDLAIINGLLDAYLGIRGKVDIP